MKLLVLLKRTHNVESKSIRQIVSNMTLNVLKIILHSRLQSTSLHMIFNMKYLHSKYFLNSCTKIVKVFGNKSTAAVKKNE